MTAIAASFVRAQTMADGTLRLIVDVEPRDAVAAFGLFGQPGTAMALAALKPDAAPEPEPEKLKGGFAAKWLGMRCAEQRFWKFLTESYDLANPIQSEHQAAELVRDICGVSSRSEIDHYPDAKTSFDRHFRLPYMKWCAMNGFTAPEYA